MTGHAATLSSFVSYRTFVRNLGSTDLDIVPFRLDPIPGANSRSLYDRWVPFFVCAWIFDDRCSEVYRRGSLQALGIAARHSALALVLCRSIYPSSGPFGAFVFVFLFLQPISDTYTYAPKAFRFRPRWSGSWLDRRVADVRR